MNLDEAIRHAREVANRERELYKMCPEDCDGLSDCRELKNGKDKGCNKCAADHEQLAAWLEELKARRETMEMIKNHYILVEKSLRDNPNELIISKWKEADNGK